MRASFRRLLAVATKEVRQLSRDRVTFGMIVGVPLMQITLFGYAINYDVRNIATVVQDDANTSMSREFVAQLRATQVVDVKYTTASSAELERLMREGRASMAVVIPRDFERRLQTDTRAVVQILVDGSIVEVFADGSSATSRHYPSAASRWVIESDSPYRIWPLR
jgi:ABC-2 type transport system permease protein